MKKIIAIAALVMCSAASYAQSASVPAVDTLNATDTATMNQPSAGYFAGVNGTFSVGLVATKVSGTTAANAVIEASVDGTNFRPLYGTSADTFALANTSGAQVKHWFITGVRPAKVRVRVYSSGTQVTALKAYYIAK